MRPDVWETQDPDGPADEPAISSPNMGSAHSLEMQEAWKSLSC